MGWNYVAGTRMVTEECYKQGCGITFGMTEDLQRRRLEDRQAFYCPNGHSQAYTGPSTQQRLDQAKARETALRDQLEASVRDGENTRRALIRDRHRFANGVCPCCNRSFSNVRRHMTSKHPEYDTAQVEDTRPVYRCSCGRSFDTPHGLGIHQTRQRRPSYKWTDPKTPKHMAHLTIVRA